MANALGEDLTDRYVVLREEGFKPQFRPVQFRVYFVEGGFGASPATRGQGMFGYSPFDGEKWRVEGYDVERFATDEEIALATKGKES